VGNLPPSTTVGALKDHFSREATYDIESVFLISKSNCAFVNYQSETACFAAMDRFHNSRFRGVRLVCRPRHSTPVSGSSHPLGPTTRSSGNAVETSPQIANSKSLSNPVNGYGEHCSLDSAHVPEKYFVVKSLTLQDLEASVHSGVWASQSRNKAALNHAYEVRVFSIDIMNCEKTRRLTICHRLPRISFSSSPRTSLVNILVTLA
jgi:hypothetical protein